MTQEFRAGQRVKVTVEGTVRRGYESFEGLGVTLGVGDDFVYLELEEHPDVAVEVIPEPLKDGLYYLAGGPIEVDFTQMSLMYKLEGGQWYDSQLDEINPPPSDIEHMVRMGPVEP